MHNVRCRCGKIVCQAENLPGVLQGEGAPELLATPAVVILCRHCKRHVILHIPATAVVHSTRDGIKAKEAHFLSTGL